MKRGVLNTNIICNHHSNPLIVGYLKPLCLLIVATLISTGILSGQPLKEVPLGMMIEVAEDCFERRDYYHALEWFEKAYKEERIPEIEEKIALLHYTLRDYKRAERWYERLVIRRDNPKPEDVFIYSKILKMNGKYEAAVDGFNLFANLVEDDEKQLLRADNEVAGIQMARETEAPIELVIENMGRTINSSYGEFGPALSPEGELYYSSIRSREVIVLDGKEGDYHAKIYTSSIGKNNNWQKPKSLNNKINRDGYHTGNVAFSSDGEIMYFSRAILDGSYLDNSRIYFSNKRSGGWGAATEVEGINGDYISTHPATGELYGNKVLFFSSDMPGGFGGFDLYYATETAPGVFTLPVNLGPGLNTSSDEITPFFLDNVLYFSSDGHPGIGAFDIFSSSWSGTEFANPENVGKGYNSSFDDLYYTVSKGGKRGLIVSNRPSDQTRSLKSKTCCDDIFTFTVRDIVIDLLTMVYDQDKNPLEGATLTLFEIINNTPGNAKTKTNPISNKLNILLDQDKSYRAVVEKEGYYPDEFQFNTVGLVDNHTLRKDVFLVRSPDAEPEIEIVTINQPIRLNNIYYDFDDDKILSDAEKDLEVLLDLLDQYPDMVIELSSHTDARGNDRYNEDLSQRRAQSAKDWLTSNGIDPDRIQAVGYGESQILNECVNGVRCSDEEHRLNRRSEFKIIAGPTSIEMKKEVIRGSDSKKN
jgi:peptidoglycan-associated lipoprotein